MKYVSLLLYCFLFLGCVSNSKESTYQIKTDTILFGKIIQLNELPEIGVLLDDSIRKAYNRRTELLTSSSQLSPFTNINCKGKDFQLAWNSEGKLIYISTTDSNFLTNDNFKVGTTLSEIKDHQKIEISEMSGWGYFIKLESGWYLGFCVDNSCTGRKIKNSDKVKWIFKK
jgi:hypothetical protein